MRWLVFHIVLLTANIALGAAPATEPAQSTTPTLIYLTNVHYAASNIYWSKGAFQQSLDQRRAALVCLHLFYGNTENSRIAVVNAGISDCLLHLDRSREALTYAKTALSIYQRIGDGKDEPIVAEVLHAVGADYQASNDLTDAIPFYEQSVDMYKRLNAHGDNPDVAREESTTGSALYAAGRIPEAIPFFQDSLKIRERLARDHDSAPVAESLGNLALCYKTQDLNADALPLAARCLAIYERLYANQDNPELARALYSYARALGALARYGQALPYFDASLQMRQRLAGNRDNADVASSANEMGLCLESLGRPDEAVRYFDDALRMRARLYKGTLNPSLAASLCNGADCLQLIGHSDHALAAYKAALQLYQHVYAKKDHPDIARTLSSIGRCLDNLDRSAEALSFNQDALDMYQRLHPSQDHPDVARCLGNLANTYRALGKLDKAITLYTSAVELERRLKSPGLFNGAESLAHLYLYMGHPDQAADEYEEAIDAFEQLRVWLGGDDLDRMSFANTTLHYGNPYNGMARAQLALGHPEKAAEFLDRGRAKGLIDILERGERISGGDLLDPLEKKAHLTNNNEMLDYILTIRNDIAAAQDQVLELRSQINHARSLNNDAGLAEINRLQPQLDVACKKYADANRLKFILAGRTTFTQSATALEIQSLVKANQHLLMYSIAQSGGIVLVIPPPGQPITGVSLTGPDGKIVPGDEIADQIYAYRKQVKQHGSDSARGFRLVDTSPATQPADDMTANGFSLFQSLVPEKVWKEIKDDQLVYVVPDEAMAGLPLEMLVVQKPTDSQPANCAYWLDNGPLICYGPSAAALLELRRQEPSRTVTSYAHQAVLLGDPVLQRNSDGPLVPTPKSGALVTSVTPGSHAESIGLRAGAVILAYGPIDIASKDQFSSAADQLELLHFHGKLAGTPKLKFWLDGQILLRDLPLDTALGVDLSDVSAALAMQTADALRTRDATLTRYGDLLPLPGTRIEVSGIYQVLTGHPYAAKKEDDSVVVLLGEDATTQKLEEAVKGTRYLHLATHGLVEPGQSARYSGIVLSLPSVVTPQDTGLLTLDDLIDHWWGKLDGTELVVLSACDSEGLDAKGSNSSTGGDGVFGLPWGFMYAGAPAVVASLWEVQDQSTAQLMQSFYADMQSTPAKLAAFTAARKQLRKTYPEPYFWAPFIYLGDPN